MPSSTVWMVDMARKISQIEKKTNSSKPTRINVCFPLSRSAVALSVFTHGLTWLVKCIEVNHSALRAFIAILSASKIENATLKVDSLYWHHLHYFFIEFFILKYWLSWSLSLNEKACVRLFVCYLVSQAAPGTPSGETFRNISSRVKRFCNSNILVYVNATKNGNEVET